MSINGIDIIYWINLDSSTERKENMEEMFKDPCFKEVPVIKRFSAVDGSNPELINSMIHINTKKITVKEYACLLSHLEIIKNFSKSSYNIALIMEDDVTLDFKQYWKNDVQTIIKNAPDDWDIIMLAYISNEIPLYTYTFNNDTYWSTLAYVINKQSAKKIINEMYKNEKYYVTKNYKHDADVYIFQMLKTYTYKYPLFIYKYDESSTLHQDAIGGHNDSRKRIEYMYNNVNKKNKKLLKFEGFEGFESFEKFVNINNENNNIKYNIVIISILFMGIYYKLFNNK